MLLSAVASSSLAVVAAGGDSIFVFVGSKTIVSLL